MWYLILIAAVQFCLVIAMAILRLWPSSEETPRKPTRKQPYYGKPTLKPDWTKKPEHIEHIQPAKNAPEQPVILFTGYLPQQREFSTPASILTPSQADVRSLAGQLAAEANMELESTLWIYRQVIDNGGLRPYRNGRELNEFQRNVPIHFRRHAGQTPDQIADILGYESDSELYKAIQKEQRLRTQLTASLPNKQYTSKHFYDDAQAELFDVMNPEPVA